MGEGAINVAKSAPQGKTGNKAVLHTVRVMFQVYPGVEGSDAERGIPKIPYTLHVMVNGQKVSQKGETGPDGGLDITLPIDAKAVIEIFDTLYAISIVGKIFSPPETRTGVISRLKYLGYLLQEDGGSDDDRTLIEFQADSGIHANGRYSDNTIVNEIKRAFGE